MPGTSGLLTPYQKMDGLYFDDSMEPDDFIFEFRKSIEEILKESNVSYIGLQFDSKEGYYDVMNSLRNFNDSKIHVSTSSREDDLILIVEKELDMDGKEKYNQKLSKLPQKRKKSTEMDGSLEESEIIEEMIKEEEGE